MIASKLPLHLNENLCLPELDRKRRVRVTICRMKAFRKMQPPMSVPLCAVLKQKCTERLPTLHCFFLSLQGYRIKGTIPTCAGTGRPAGLFCASSAGLELAGAFAGQGHMCSLTLG